MIIQKTSEFKNEPKINLLIYGDAKVGKSTFASSAPSPLVGDAESGWNYMGVKGINVPVAKLEKWEDMKEFYLEAKKPQYQTIIIDPVNEILEKLLQHAKRNNLYVQATDKNALSMRGWGFVKEKMREMLKGFRDLNKNVIFIAHVKTIEDDGAVKKIPRLDANLSGDLMAMMDIIGYFTMINKNDEEKRIICFKPSARWDAGDRTDTLPEFYDATKGFEPLYNILKENKVFAFNKKIEAKKVKAEEEFVESLPEIKNIEASEDNELLEETEEIVSQDIYDKAKVEEKNETPAAKKMKQGLKNSKKDKLN